MVTDGKCPIRQGGLRAIEHAPASGDCLTRDMGGTASTQALGTAIAEAVSIHGAEERADG